MTENKLIVVGGNPRYGGLPWITWILRGDWYIYPLDCGDNFTELYMCLPKYQIVPLK